MGGAGITPVGPGIVPVHKPDTVAICVVNADTKPDATAGSLIPLNAEYIPASNGDGVPPIVIVCVIVAVIPGGGIGFRLLPIQ